MSDATQTFGGVTIETTVLGQLRTVTSVREAAECLLGEWPVCGSDELNVKFEDVNVAGVWFVRVIIRCDDCVADTTGPPSVLCPTEEEAEEDARLKWNSWAKALKAARPPEPEGTED